MAYLDIVIPATTEVVDRGPGLAAYLNGQDAMAGALFSLVRLADGRVEIDVDDIHGLEVGDQVIIDGVLPSGNTADVEGGTPSTDWVAPDDAETGTTDASIMSTISETGTYEGVWQRAVRTPDERIMIVSGQTQVDSVTFTPNDFITIFEKVSEATAGNGGRQVTYQWTRISNDGAHGFVGGNFGMRGACATVLIDGRVLATGGADNDDSLGVPTAGWDLLQYLPPDSISQQSGVLPAGRAAHAQCSLNASSGGGALVSGGWTVIGTPLATTLRFDVLSLTWNVVTPMAEARMHHELIPINGQVMAVGGAADSGPTTTLASCELYHPFPDLWFRTGNMTYARTNFGWCLLPNSKVLVVGGYGKPASRGLAGNADLSSCEVYDSGTELWSNIPSMPSARRYPIVQYLEAENIVLVAGGGVATIDVLDVATMKWKTLPGTIASAHTISAGAIASDDTLLISGGLFGDGTEALNYVLTPGSDNVWLGAGLNGHFRVDEVPDGTHIVVNTTEYNYGDSYTVARAGATVTPKAAEASPTGIPGPFSYDVKNGFAITATASTTDDSFNHGGHYASIHLVPTIDDPDPALNFPDEEGFIVLQFGYKNVVGPIRYFGRLSDEDLILDAGSPFQAVIPPGATVRLLSSRLPFAPDEGDLIGNFYATGTAAGRVAAQQTINDIVAAGKQVLVSILYPGDRGLGGAGFPQKGNYKLSDKVSVWGGDDLDQEIPAARTGQ